MKSMKKILALVVAMLLVSAMAYSAFAVTISIERDSSYDGSGTGSDGNIYKWYKVFSATYTSGTVSTTGGGQTSGTASYWASGTTDGGMTVTAGAVSYIANASVGAKLQEPGNLWFTVTAISGSTNFNVSWKEGVPANADTIQAAANWLVENKAYEASGDMTFGDGKWTASVAPGYYVVQGLTGKNLVAATTDIEIKEKNEYPSDDKKQADEDNATMTDENKKVAIGDVLNYEVTIHIPATAKVGDLIVVWDKASQGLTYNNDVEVKTNEGNATVTPGTKGSNYSGTGSESTAAWNQQIKVTAGSQGKDVVFKFSMTVNSDALTDGDKKNESGLKFGHENGSGTDTFPYESKPDEVKYETYYTGIHKFDPAGSGTDLEGVKFTLKEAGKAFNVTLKDGIYVADPSGSSEVVTDAQGMIFIRGLDNDKTYTLTETETLPGYNMLDEDVTLTLKLDTVTIAKTDESGTTTTTTYSFNSGSDHTSSGTWGQVENKTGTVLPSTGGMGTTIIYIVGALLVIGAGVLLVSKRRAN